ncbi:MAG: M14 family metallopeptidase [Candidatus Aminicenantes bacterium]|nr:M14 family metallopeptidase [Candidatus Aminicenantes bacterium]
MKRIAWLLVICLASLLPAAEEILTVAERSNYTRTSLYGDVMDFLHQVQRESDRVKILPLAVSPEGRMVPLVVLSKEKVSRPSDLALYGKPAVLVMANIHAGEVEGKEAVLMLIRDIARGNIAGLLDSQVLLFIPIFNADGNEKLGRHRRDLGPELAGVRFNGQNLDLNRDYLKLESPEVRALVDLFNSWDPLLVVDMHTTNGSYHREPVTYSTLLNPNGCTALSDYMWQELFPAVARALKNVYGYDSVPYGNFVDREFPEKGWISDALEGRYGSNYVGLRNRFSVLDENYSYADFRTRVLASRAFVASILAYTARNIGAMLEMTRRADRDTSARFSQGGFVLEFEMEKLFDLTLKSYEFVKETIPPEERAKYPPWVGEFIMKKTETPKEYRLPYLALALPSRTLSLPAGYVLAPFHPEALAILKRHGIRVERILDGFRAEAESFVITAVEPGKNIYQGHVQNTIKGQYEKAEVDIPAGSHYIGLDQPLARLVPVLLEPESTDSLAAWGFFNRVIVQQWSNRPGPHPVHRLARKPAVPLLSE